MSNPILGRFHSDAPEGVSPVHLKFLRDVPLLITIARDAAQDDSYSYRDLNVGAAVEAVNLPLRQQVIHSAGNIKNNRNIETECAEKRTLGALAGSGMMEVAGLVVAGPTDVEEIRSISGNRLTRTLYPCYRCLSFLFPDDRFITEDAVVVTTGRYARDGEDQRSNDIIEAHTVADLNVIERLGAVDLLNGPAIQGTANWDKRVQYFVEQSQQQTEVAPQRRLSAGDLVVNALRFQITA